MANPIEGMMSVAMENIKQMVDVNTIVGEAIRSEDGTVIIPISKVSFGFGAGGSEFNAAQTKKESVDGPMFGGGAGGGVSINPVAFMVVGKDQIRLLPVSSSITTVDRVIDMVPELLNRFNSFVQSFGEKKAAKQAEDAEVSTSETIIIEE